MEYARRLAAILSVMVLAYYYTAKKVDAQLSQLDGVELQALADERLDAELTRRLWNPSALEQKRSGEEASRTSLERYSTAQLFVEMQRRTLAGFRTDDRRESGESTRPVLICATPARGMLFRREELDGLPDGSWRLKTNPMPAGYTLSANEPVADPHSVQKCSGILVKSDVFATPAQCLIDDPNPNILRVILKLERDRGGSASSEFAANEVFEVDSVIEPSSGPHANEWALLRLNRPATEVEPLTAGTSGPGADGTPGELVGELRGAPKP